MRCIDVCNGDADGLCAVRQWRLADPRPALLVTGPKRDVALLDRVAADAGDEVLVCDVSMQANRAALLRLLGQGVRVRYFDHHATGEVPTHPGLQAHLDFSASVCTCLLMDRHLGGRFRAWALAGAYGDNLTALADALAADGGFDAGARGRLRRLGEAINYNAYGEDIGDLHIAPQRLYEILSRHDDPLRLFDAEPVVGELETLKRADLEQALAVAPLWSGPGAQVLRLPDAPWSRRVIGTLANALAAADPQRAQAVLKADRQGGYVVSLRAPLAAPHGANEFCCAFGGAGRAGAAGIDHLPQAELDRFVAALAARWGAPGGGDGG